VFDNRSSLTPQSPSSLARIYTAVPAVMCYSWKHTLFAESFSVHQQTRLDALQKIPHADGCDKIQRHCLYKGITSQAA